MKTKILLAFFMLVAGLTFGQKQNIEDISVVAPKFQNEFYDSENEYFYQNAEYPSEARSARIQGISVVGFTVTENGEITEVVIKNSLSKEIDDEVLRLLEASNGKWTPGKVNGKPVSMPSEISVTFALNTSSDMIRTAKNHLIRANKLMYDKNKLEKAIRSYDRAASILPNNEAVLVARILCNYELNEVESAEKDFERLKTLALQNGISLEPEIYADLNSFVKKMNASTK